MEFEDEMMVKVTPVFQAIEVKAESFQAAENAEVKITSSLIDVCS